MCVSNTSFKKEERRKVTFHSNETCIDFVFVKKQHPRFMQDVKAIPGWFLHSLMVANIDKKKVRNVVRKTCTVRQKISLLKDWKVRMRHIEKLIELVDIGVPNLWRHFKDGVLGACDEMCW